MTQTRPRKPIRAICQPPREMRICAIGEAITRPSEPSADTMPMVTLRRAGVTAREATLMATLEAVQESARPTQMPEPSIRCRAEVALIMRPSPAA